MQTIVLLATLVAAALAIPSETYDANFDNFNSEEISENIRFLENFAKCLTGEGSCTAEGTYIKKNMSEALKTNCAKCSPKQRQHIRTIALAMKEKLPDSWTKVVQQQDPKGEYKKTFDDFLNSKD